MTIDETTNGKFTVGDQVVHPHHGVGVVVGLEEKRFTPSVARIYYVISIPNTTLWVPVELSLSGLRKLSQKDELEECRQVLQETPQVLNAGKDLMANLSARIKQGTLLAQCEVVRDLTAFGWLKPLYDPLAGFQRGIMNVLCQEWAAIQGITQTEAASEITDLIKKGRTDKKN